jgi:hypothetical protein
MSIQGFGGWRPFGDYVVIPNPAFDPPVVDKVPQKEPEDQADEGRSVRRKVDETN